MKLTMCLGLMIFATTVSAHTPTRRISMPAHATDTKAQSAGVHKTTSGQPGSTGVIPPSTAAAQPKRFAPIMQPTEQSTIGNDGNRKVCRVDGNKIYYCR